MRKLFQNEIVEIDLLLNNNKTISFISKELHIPQKLIKQYLKSQKIKKHNYFYYINKALENKQITKEEFRKILNQYYQNRKKRFL